MTVSLTTTFAKWFKNKTSWTQMTLWKTNFNMPAVNVFDNSTTYTETEWMLDALSPATTFDFTWFEYWWEAIQASSVFTVYWDFAWWSVTVKQTWKKPNWTFMFDNEATINFQSLTAWQWYSHQLISNQWVAPWEIDVSWTYTLTMSMTWDITNSQVFNVVINNVPAFTWYKTKWYIRVEWDNLKYTSDNQFEHTIIWDLISNPVASPWTLWIDSTDNKLCYIASDWRYRKSPTALLQFSSSFSNSATAWVTWQTPWYIWIDAEFWFTHIAYIWNDWKKYLTWSWNNPYINPY